MDSMPKSSSVQSKKYSSYTPPAEVYMLKMISTSTVLRIMIYS